MESRDGHDSVFVDHFCSTWILSDDAHCLVALLRFSSHWEEMKEINKIR